MAREPYYRSVPEEPEKVEVIEAEEVEPDEAYGGRKKLPYNDTTRVKNTIRRYGTPKELRMAINAYFEDCEKCEYYEDDEGRPILYKGEPVYKKPPTPPTTTGLALALGFPSRQSLVDFCRNDVLSQSNDVRSQTVEQMGNPKFANKEYRDLILQAFAICERYMEEKLYDKDTANGAKFALSNSDKRWSDKAALDLTLKTAEDSINADEAVKRLQALGFTKTRKPKESKKDKEDKK